jgi:hypothetical protein
MYASATHDTILSSHLKRFYPFHPRAFGRLARRKPDRVKPKPKSREGAHNLQGYFACNALKMAVPILLDPHRQLDVLGERHRHIALRRRTDPCEIFRTPVGIVCED